MILNKRPWEFLLEWVGIRIVLRQRKTLPLWHQYHQHITPPPVTRWGFWSLSCTALLVMPPPQHQEQGRHWKRMLCVQLELNPLNSYSQGNDWMFTLPNVSSRAEEQGLGHTTLPYHKASKKLKQHIHESDLIAHMMDTRTFLPV